MKLFIILMVFAGAVNAQEERVFKYNTGAIKTNYETVLVIDKNGFVFKGTRINDAGKAYRAWMETMEIMKKRNEKCD